MGELKYIEKARRRQEDKGAVRNKDHVEYRGNGPVVYREREMIADDGIRFPLV